MSICLYVCLSACLSVCLSVRLSVCVCLSVCFSGFSANLGAELSKLPYGHGVNLVRIIRLYPAAEPRLPSPSKRHLKRFRRLSAFTTALSAVALDYPSLNRLNDSAWKALAFERISFLFSALLETVFVVDCCLLFIETYPPRASEMALYEVKIHAYIMHTHIHTYIHTPVHTYIHIYQCDSPYRFYFSYSYSYS